MRIDVSRDSFDLVQGYTRVFLQQGRPILDRDWNEQTSIVLYQLRAVTRSIYGRHGGPAGGECGFIPVEGSEGKFLLQGGWYALDGLVLTCKQGTAYADQDYFKPNKLENGRDYLIYLEALEREVTAAEQEGLLESALPGVDVAARGQVVWRANHVDWPPSSDQRAPDNRELGSCSKDVENVNRWLKTREANRSGDIVLPPGNIRDELTKDARKYPNQLFRIEYHSENIWKYSTDNAFALFKVAQSPASNEITIRLGAIGDWAPNQDKDKNKYKFVELLTKENLLFNEPGELREVDRVRRSTGSQLDTVDCLKLTLAPSEIHRSGVEFLRVWDRAFNSDKLDGVSPGDYWQFINRDAELDFENAKLKRPTRVFAPLALIRTNADGVPSVINRFQRIVGIPWREINETLDLSV